MRPRRTTALLAALLFAAAAARPSVESARRLAAEGRLEEARRSLSELLAAGGDELEQAQALELLGTVALRRGDLAAAAAAWTELVERYPQAPEAWDAETGLALIADLLACRGEESAASEPQEAVPSPSPVPAPSPQPPPRPAPPEVVEPVSPRLVVVPRAEMSSAVLVAGDGTPPEVIEAVLAVLIDDLRQRGVDAEMIPPEVWWRRPYKMVAPVLLDTVRSAGAASLLWVEMRFGFRERLSVTCVGSDGRQAWRIKASGGSAYTDHRPHDEFNQELVGRVQERLAERIGESCLPAR